MQQKDSKSAPFPVDAWSVRQSRFDTASHCVSETLFALGNGYIGLRGTGEEGYGGPAGTSQDGCYLNGFYESEPIRYPEAAYGLAKQNQFMLNVPNGKGIACWIAGERVDLLQGTVEDYQRVLDFRTGVLVREFIWTSPQGRRIALSSRRVVCMQHKHLYAIALSIKALNFSGTVRLVSTLDGSVKNLEAGNDPRIGATAFGQALQLQGMEQTDELCALTHRTRHSGFTLVSAVSNVLHFSGPVTRSNAVAQQCIEQSFECSLAQDGSVTLHKFGCYFSSRDYPEDELPLRVKEALQQAREAGFDALCAGQEQFLADFWRHADVEIAGDDALQQGMRFNQFHLLQSIGRDGKTNIAAKGVTGEGYDGHYFWDTEIYIFPFFLYSKPEIARKLLEYRYQGLPKARERAREMAHAKGALFPWRTIAGEECSAYYPAGTAQYHINADIAYSIKQYLDATGDDGYLLQYGAEIVLETARIWLGIGCFIGDDNDATRFCINEVTGPDEYTALVNNNYYTNLMAQMHLRFAVAIAEKLQREHPTQFEALAKLIALEDGEIATWRRAADDMYLPYDGKLGVHPQDDSFLSKKVWDFAATPESHYPLLLHYHPLVIYRHQVCKQADVVLAQLLQSERFTIDEKRRNFDYYEKVTTHDSSLSSCIFSIIAAEVGYRDKAYDYFMETARLDLDDTHGNTCHGVHTAAMAGTWMGVAYGFAGMRMVDGSLRFAPALPTRWQHYQFRIHYRGGLLQVLVMADQVEYRLLEGAALQFAHRGKSVTLDERVPVVSLPLERADA